MDGYEFIKRLKKKQYSIAHRPTNHGESGSSNSFGVIPIPRILQNTDRKEGIRMKLREFYSLVAKKEGKKSQTSIGNIREIVKIENQILSKATKIKNFLYKAIKQENLMLKNRVRIDVAPCIVCLCKMIR